MKIDLSSLSIRDLDALILAAKRRLAVLDKRRPVAVVRLKLAKLAASHGYMLEEVFGGEAVPMPKPPKKRARRKLPKVAPKYRDPDNPRDTWTGRGRQPRWLAAKVKRGQRPADFLIPGLAKPTAKPSGVGQRSVFKAG